MGKLNNQFSNGQTTVRIFTAGEAISELQHLPPDTPLCQGAIGEGAAIVLFNEGMSTEHVKFEVSGVWDD